jgi:hypothetical protein
MPKIFAIALSFAMLLPISSAIPPASPDAEITNGLIRAKMYLPNREAGFYRGTRFDWSGALYSLEANGHNYYGAWFDETDPNVHDFIYKDGKIVAGPCSAITGPVDEFAPIGFNEAKPGETFIKIGIGALTKPAEGKYDNYHLYEISDAGEWRITKRPDAVEFVQTLEHLSSGYAYRYEKDVQLTPGKTQMVLRHRLKNTGTRPINTTVYNHNFLVLDHQPPGPGVTISVPFVISGSDASDKSLAKIDGRKIIYTKLLRDRDTFATPLSGFGDAASDNAIEIENTSAGAGLRWHTDKPLLRESLWSIRSVVAMEPYVAISVAPGAEFTWTSVYDYYTVPRSSKDALKP